MKHMNNKMVKLLHEGFSIDTLEKLNSKQLDTLYNKIFEDDKAVINVKKGSPEEAQAKAAGKAFVTYEEELEEGEQEDVANVNKGEDDQDPIQKQGPDGMGEGYISEKAVSKQQQKIMGLALSVKRGDTPKSKVSKQVQKMAKEMSKKELEDFASTKHKGLPKTVEEKDEVEKLEESILRIIENHLPPHTTKGELLNYIRRNK